jgi:putative phage-type endonuclease
MHSFRKNQPLPTEEQRRLLESLEQNSDAWHAERAKRMGASSVSSAVGLGRATPMDYWRLKTGRISVEDTEESRQIKERGCRLEAEAAAQYALLMAVVLRIVGLYVHPTIPWIHASPDRLIEGCDRGIVEIKCPLYGLPATDKPIRPEYMCQVQQQMQCVGPHVEWCDLCFYYRTEARPVGIRVWRIWRSDRYWDRMLWSMDRMATCLDPSTQGAEPTPDVIPLRPAMPRVRTKLVLDCSL